MNGHAWISRRAVALLDHGDFVTRPRRLRDALIGSPLHAYSALADVVDRSGDPARAAEILERFRVWPKRPQIEGTNVRPDTVLITYALFADRVAIYAKGQRVSVPVAAAGIKRTMHAFNEAIERNDLEGFRKHSRALSRTLIDPIAKLMQPGDVLVIVPDADLAQLPFGALVQENARYLIEDHPVVLSSSLSAWAKASSPKRTAARSVLSVGNSMPDEETVSLPMAEEEATEISKMYRSRALLIGAKATKQRVISALAYSNVAHFAVHANGGGQPHLLLAPPDARLTASEIAALKLDDMHAVVLAGCNTSAGRRSLVDAFLEAGAGNVVGSLWEIDDASTRDMSVAFHRAFRDGATPAKALQSTQVEMLRRNAPLRVWAALELYGSGS